jgi:23S rRNA pseudouridine1911/1915/1917 synthase
MNFIVDEDNAGKRLDVFLTEKAKDLNRSFINKLINDNIVSVNSKFTKSGYKLKMKDIIKINDDYKNKLIKDIINLPILYEDQDCIVINKPSGILTHSKGEFNNEPSVASFIQNKTKDLIGNRAGIVHRLDRATSGVIICAKNPDALKHLQKQFSNRKVKKTYFAVTAIKEIPKHAKIDMPLMRDAKNPKQFKPSNNGKSAITEYEVVKKNKSKMLLKLKPLTGRTHQIRVHLKQIGVPIIGDDIYGNQKFKRLLLHAESLEITLPSKLRKTFVAPIPDEFKI